MSQVFASITHRLAEAYGTIDLQTVEAKTRLLGDARYLHEKLANLKGVRMPSNMLETVVSEKPIVSLVPGSPAMVTPGSPGRQARSPPLPQTASPPAAPAPAPGSTANARIKGMFARAAKLNTAATAFADVKRAPSPNPTPAPPLEKPLPLPAADDPNGVTTANGRTSPAPPPPKRTMSGFRQVEVGDDPVPENGGPVGGS
jgi:vacuolar protein sorting-associated protein 54